MMRKYLLAASFAALGLIVAAPQVNADGPVRRVVRGTAEGTRAVVGGAAQGTRAVAGGAVQGTRTIVGGAANATGAVIGGAADAGRAVVGGTVDAGRAVVGGTIDAGRTVVGGTARGIAAGVDALTPNIPLQARAGATLRAEDQGRDARWRFAQHNGEWWYYSPENAWSYHRDGQWNQFAQASFQPNAQYSGQFAAGYRGVGGEAQYGASGQQVRHDQYGRAYVCENGQAVYLDEGQQADQGVNSADQYQGQPTPAPAIPSEAATSGQPAASADAAASGGLSGEAPRAVLQGSGQGTMGTVEPGQTAQ